MITIFVLHSLCPLFLKLLEHCNNDFVNVCPLYDRKKIERVTEMDKKISNKGSFITDVNERGEGG